MKSVIENLLSDDYLQGTLKKQRELLDSAIADAEVNTAGAADNNIALFRDGEFSPGELAGTSGRTVVSDTPAGLQVDLDSASNVRSYLGLGTMALQGAIVAVADVPAQTIDAAYNQANLQTTIDALVNKINELLTKMEAANHLAT